MRSPRASESAVSSVIGDVLLVGITITVTVMLTFALASINGPNNDRPASVAISFDPGDGGWGTGDERVVMRHTGGLPLRASQLRIQVEVDNALSSSAPGVNWPFDDDRLEIGETWNVTHYMAAGELVRATLLNLEGGSAILAYGQFTPPAAGDCSMDVTGPTVAQWTPTPADLQSTDTGAFQVEARLADDCSGVNPGAPPDLLWRIQDGTSPSWNTLGMSLLGGTRFHASIPEPGSGWSSVLGDTVEYQVVDMRDFAGNAADSAIRTDVVQESTDYYYPICPPTVTRGSSIDCIELQDAGDTSESRLTDGAEFGSVVATKYGTDAPDEPGTTNEMAATGAPDDLRAVMPDRTSTNGSP